MNWRLLIAFPNIESVFNFFGGCLRIHSSPLGIEISSLHRHRQTKHLDPHPHHPKHLHQRRDHRLDAQEHYKYGDGCSHRLESLQECRFDDAEGYQDSRPDSAIVSDNVYQELPTFDVEY